METKNLLIICSIIVVCVIVIVGAIIYVNPDYQTYDFNVCSMEIPNGYNLTDVDSSLSYNDQNNTNYFFSNGTDDFNIVFNYGVYDFQGLTYLATLNDYDFFGNEICSEGCWHYFDRGENNLPRYCVSSYEKNSTLNGLNVFICCNDLNQLKHGIGSMKVNYDVINQYRFN